MIGLHPFARIGLAELQRDARVAGLRFLVTSGRRGRAEQTKLYLRAISGQSRLPAAVPGRSTHEYGLAIDVVAANPRQQANLVALARRLGWVWAGPADPVHFQVVSQADWSAALRLSPRNPLAVLR